MTIPVSAVVITLNEEGNIQRCLESLEFCAELLVVDSGSTFERGIRPKIVKLVFSPIMRFLKLYVLRQGFRDGVPGFVLASISSFFCFYKYAMLFELDYKSRHESSL